MSPSLPCPPDSSPSDEDHRLPGCSLPFLVALDRGAQTWADLLEICTASLIEGIEAGAKLTFVFE
jgi:hypothetical protein